MTRCRERDYRYPEITGWIRAYAADLALVKEMGLAETGILTSVSDYHIFLKLKWNRRKAMDDYLAIVKAALDVVGPKGMQAEAAKVAAGPFLTAVNLVLRRFDLKAYVETERNGKAVFEWGLEHTVHGKRRWEVLPTSYRAIMGAAVALAFFSLRAAKKAVLIMDDLEHLDSGNRTRFFEAVAAAIMKDRTLDLFVGAQTLPQKPGKVLKVINLGAQRPAAASEESNPDTQAA